jgi:hypothetical protein
MVTHSIKVCLVDLPPAIHGATSRGRQRVQSRVATVLNQRPERGIGRHRAVHLLPQGQYQTAISHLKRVLEISKEMADHVGDADAYGTIAGTFRHLRHV